jgi:hypothetical protein
MNPLAEIEAAIEAIARDSKKLISKKLRKAAEACAAAQKEALQALRKLLN